MNDNIYDTKEFKKEELDFLRTHTKLGPISALKIKKAQVIAESYRQNYLKNEGELLESDYSIAEQLEYELRQRAWENLWAKEWKRNNDGIGLSEFANMAMEQMMSESRKQKR